MELIVANTFTKYEKGGKLTQAEMMKYGRMEVFQKKLQAEMKEFPKEIKSVVLATSAKSVKESYYRTSYSFEAVLRDVFLFGLESKDIQQIINMYSGGVSLDERLKKNNADNIWKIKSSIAQGLIFGQGFGQMTRNLKQAIGGATYKAFRILTTETHRSAVEAELRAIEDAENDGIKTDRVWLATLGARTRDSHRYMDTQKAGKDKYFKFRSGIVTKGPGMSNVAAEDIHCRCSVAPEIIDYPLKKEEAVQME